MLKKGLIYGVSLFILMTIVNGLINLNFNWQDIIWFAIISTGIFLLFEKADERAESREKKE